MSKYLRVGPGALDCLPRSYYSDVKYHLTMQSQSSLRQPHLVTRSNGDLVLDLQRLQYHLKPQPCYTKPYSDSQHSVSSLSIIFAASVLMSTYRMTYPAPASRQ
ncbi:hypothetical protein P692DRAFT_20842484 [Suillus brevipes Sb2]|nr:hypothetical protein P692DRAFT_20842484 [Suillus brevipes Sb2]